MKLITSIVLSFISLCTFAQEEDKELLIKKSRIEFLMGKLEELNVTKLRLANKDTIISELNLRLTTKDVIIASYVQTVSEYEHQKTLLQDQTKIEHDLNKELKKNYNKLRIQNVLLKVGVVALVVVEGVILVLLL